LSKAYVCIGRLER